MEKRIGCMSENVNVPIMGGTVNGSVTPEHSQLIASCEKLSKKFWRGQELSNGIKSGDLSGFQNGWKEVGLKMLRILNWIWNLEARLFEIRKNGCHVVKNHLKSRLKCLDCEWSSFQKVVTIPITTTIDRLFENYTIWNLIFKNSRFLIFPYF